MKSMHAASALAAVLSLAGSGASMPSFVSTEKHAPIKTILGHVYGRGKRKQPRNAPCSCGSGKKAKACCVFEKEPENANQTTAQPAGPSERVRS